MSKRFPAESFAKYMTDYHTPPPWMRRWLPWWLLKHLADRVGLCWASVVSWKIGYNDEWKVPDVGCWNGEHDHGPCYCGMVDRKDVLGMIREGR